MKKWISLATALTLLMPLLFSPGEKTLAGAVGKLIMKEGLPAREIQEEGSLDFAQSLVFRENFESATLESWGISKLRDVQVHRIPQERLRAASKEIQRWEEGERDALGEEELSRAGDPSFESVARHFPPMKYPREAVGVKEHPHGFGVAPDGSITFPQPEGGWAGDVPVAFFEVGSPPLRFGSQGFSCSKGLLEGFLPVVFITADRDGIFYEEVVFGHSQGMQPESTLWAFVRLTVSNRTGEEWRESLGFRILPVLGEKRVWSRSLRIPPQAQYQVFLKFRYPATESEIVEVEQKEFDERLSEVTNWWKNLLDSGMHIRVPEERINHAFKAWLVHNFLLVDKINGTYEPHDGIGFYEAVFDYSAALYCHALDLTGFRQEAEKYLESLLASVSPEGVFFRNYGLPGTGALLFALSEHYRLTGSADWLRMKAPVMLKMCNWILETRKASMKERDGKKPVTYGLIRFTPYADFQQKTCNYYGDCYSCVGLESAARVLQDIGLARESSRLAREAEAYRKDILASMDAAAFERHGMRILPMEPDTHRLLKSTGYRGGGYYGLIASMMLESGFLPPEDERALWVTRFMERKKGLILGMCEFNGGVDHAYTYGYWLHCLHRDQVRRVLLGFYGSLAYGMSPTTFCSVEVTGLRTGDNTPTTPHLYSGTQQLRLLRMMLVRSEGDTLLLGQAIPRHWLAAGSRVEVWNAPTVFGKVGFSIESDAQGKTMKAAIDPPDRITPRSIRLRLRHPEGKSIRSVALNGKTILDFSADTVNLPDLRSRTILQINFQ